MPEYDDGQTPQSQLLLGGLLLGVLVVLAGCATISVHSSVTADGMIDTYRIQINTSQQAYALLNEDAKEDGYDGLRDMVTSSWDESNDRLSYDETFHGDEVTITLVATDFDPANSTDVHTRVYDGMMIYEDDIFVSSESSAEMQDNPFVQSITVHYYLTMPGEITNSNADEVNGNTAEWHETGADALFNNHIYAASEIPLSTRLPGFGPVVAIVAILGAAMLFAKRVREA